MTYVLGPPVYNWYPSRFKNATEKNSTKSALARTWLAKNIFRSLNLQVPSSVQQRVTCCRQSEPCADASTAAWCDTDEPDTSSASPAASHTFARCRTDLRLCWLSAPGVWCSPGSGTSPAWSYHPVHEWYSLLVPCHEPEWPGITKSVKNWNKNKTIGC